LIAQRGATEDQWSLNRWFAGHIDKGVQSCTDGSNIASVAFLPVWILAPGFLEPPKLARRLLEHFAWSIYF
jgi:hypothetical protein